MDVSPLHERFHSHASVEVARSAPWGCVSCIRCQISCVDCCNCVTCSYDETGVDVVADKQGARVGAEPRTRAHSGHVSRHCVHHVCTRDGNAWQLLQNARIPRLASVASILFLFPVLDALGRSCPLTHRKIRTPSDDPSGWVVWACRPASRHFPKPKSVDAALRVATAKDSKGFLSVSKLVP